MKTRPSRQGLRTGAEAFPLWAGALRSAAFALVCLSFWPLRSAAQFTGYHLTDNKQYLEIPFENFNEYIVLKITLNKVLPLRFILDTGSKYSILSKKEYAEILGLELGKKYTIIGSDRQALLDAYVVRDLTLDFSGVHAERQSLLVLEEDRLGFDGILGTPVDGILGADFFLRFIVKIDYQANKLTLYERENFPKPGKNFSKLPLEIEDNYSYLPANVTLPDGEKLGSRLLLDSGAGLVLLMHLNPEDTLKMRTAVPGNIGRGLGGTLKGYMGWVKEIQFAPLGFQQLVACYQMPTKLDSLYPPRRSGILGNMALSRFVVILDYQDSSIYLKPNSRYKKQFKFDKSGIVLRAEGPGLRQLTVDNVMNGSPAQKAGIQVGDHLLRANHTGGAFLSLAKMSSLFTKKPGTKIRLVLERNGEKCVKEIVLEDLLKPMGSTTLAPEEAITLAPMNNP